LQAILSQDPFVVSTVSGSDELSFSGSPFPSEKFDCSEQGEDWRVYRDEFSITGQKHGAQRYCGFVAIRPPTGDGFFGHALNDFDKIRSDVSWGEWSGVGGVPAWDVKIPQIRGVFFRQRESRVLLLGYNLVFRHVLHLL
jgi:hypothetical protein